MLVHGGLGVMFLRAIRVGFTPSLPIYLRVGEFLGITGVVHDSLKFWGEISFSSSTAQKPAIWP